MGTALAGGIGSVALVLILAMSTYAGATPSPSAVLRAPYKGSVQPYENLYLSGCGSLKILNGTGFNLRTGSGGSLMTGKADMCKSAGYGNGQNSYVEDYVSPTVGIPFRSPSTIASGTVTVVLNASWSVEAKATDGNTSCNQGTSYRDESYSDQWGYNSSTGSYANSNSSYWDYGTNTRGFVTAKTWSNGTSGSPLPRPLRYNSSSSFSWSQGYGVSYNCYSFSAVYGGVSGQLRDESTGQSWGPSGSTVGTGGSGNYFSIYVWVTELIQYSCANSTNWNGPAGTWSNGSLYCSTNPLNDTDASYWYEYEPSSFQGMSLVNNSVVLSSSASNPGTWWFNTSLKRTDQYALFFTVSVWGQASNSPGWTRGYGYFINDMATSGNGVRLESISVV